MACSFYCENCGENLGKDKELSKRPWCGTCGQEGGYNEYGDDDD